MKPYERYYYKGIQIMHLTLKQKETEKKAVIQTIKEDKFVSNIHNISKQIKDKIDFVNNHLGSRKMRISRVSEKKNTIVSYNNHKFSLQTACSYFSTCHHSAEKTKTLPFDNPEHNYAIKGHLQDLDTKNSGYAIRWKNSVSTISKSMRVILAEWLMQLSQQLQIPKNCVYNAMHYVDKYVGMVNVARSRYQAIGLCSLFVASKLQMGSHPSINIFIQALDSSISKCQLLQLEQQILFKLKFKLNPPTLYQYMVLLISLFNHYLIEKQKNTSFIDISLDSKVYKDIFWMLDGVFLENQYKNFKNKEKVCLAILYICIKKQRYLQANIDRSKLMKQFQEMKVVGQTQKVFQVFLSKIIRNFKLTDLKECVQFFRGWAKFDRNSVGEEEQIQLLKRIIFNS